VEAARSATLDDVPAIVELATRLREQVAAFRGSDLWAAREAKSGDLTHVYSELIADPHVDVVVGTIDDVVFGFGVGERERLADGRLLGVISDLYVEPDARDIGVGEAVVSELLERFRRDGCAGVDAWALPGDRNTKNFFETHGFVSRLIVAHKRLGDEEA